MNPNAFFGRGQGPDKHIVVNEGDSLQNQAKLAEIEFIESLIEGVMLRMFGACFWDAFPTELTGLCFSLTGQAVKEGQVAMLSTDGPGGNALSSEWGHGGLRVKGTPVYGKGVFARGFHRSSTDVDWWGEDGPTTPDSDDYKNKSKYSGDESGTDAWLPMWDYPRVY
ncbi:MAG: hypothetical protein EOM12_13520 [Verrucomicrobiae bacterium]|nr:hypothetical protein [Verrucomicrobiae bacterium]